MMMMMMMMINYALRELYSRAWCDTRGPEVKSTQADFDSVRDKVRLFKTKQLQALAVCAFHSHLNPPILLVVWAAKSEPTLISSDTAGDCSKKKQENDLE